MKKVLFGIMAVGALISAPAVQAQNMGDVLNDLFGGSSRNNSSKSGSSGNASLGGLTNSEVVSGLKEALRIGAQNAGTKLSARDGYLGNALVKIAMPPEARKVESALRSVGMGSLADKAIVAMNRAAEDAAKEAAPIFINAITSMSIQDGVQILTGGNNAATNFLKGKTTAALTAAFAPVIQKSLNKVNAPEIWNSVFSTYNSLPLSQQKVNTDLTAYVTERALSGLFTMIAQEEQKIRTDPAAQVTGLLKKVFGNK